nr:reverse transcriptase domain-containing protein [Tanacetum cinerariifolium]
MSTRSSARNLFPTLDNLGHTIRRRHRVDPNLLNDFEIATDGNGDDANKHLDMFLHVTQSIKVNGVTDDALHLYLFPHSLTHHPTAWFDRLPRNSINTFEQMAKMFLGKYFPPSIVTKLRNEITNFRQRPDESLFKAWERYKISIDCCPNHNMLPCYDLIENLIAHHNDWDTSVQKSESSSSITSSFDQNPPLAYQAPAYQAPGYQALVHQAPIPQLQVVTTTEFTNYMKENDAILKNMQTNMTSLKNSNLELKNMFVQFMKMNTASSLGLRTLQSNTITNPKEDLKVECEAEVTKDTVPPTNNVSTKEVQPPIVQIETPILNSEPVVAPKLPEKLGDPGKFLIPCDFPRIDECLALADLDVSINLMPLSVWNKLSLLELSPTCMTLELADRLISRLVGVTEDVYVKLETFHFLNDFVVVDFDADPRVPLILRRSFLKTGRALIDVYEGELTLRICKEAVTFNLDQTLRYSANYDPMSDSDFLLEETDAFLAIDDEPISLEIDGSYYDSKGDILLLEEFLIDDPSSPPLPPQELKVVEPTNEKSSIDEPPVVELKDLPPHLEYAFLEGDDKLPVIIEKDLKDEDKTALIKHQRRVNPKIHEVIKKEVIKPLDSGLIYPISDSPLVSPVHCVPKKAGFTIVENEENELIPTRMVTGWRVCIEYQKLNDATRKDHFPLTFMDQMLEILAGNEYYCFLDSFLGYFQIPIDPKIKKRPHSRVLTECLPTVAYLLGYAMHRARFKCV